MDDRVIEVNKGISIGTSFVTRKETIAVSGYMLIEHNRQYREMFN